MSKFDATTIVQVSENPDTWAMHIVIIEDGKQTGEWIFTHMSRWWEFFKNCSATKDIWSPAAIFAALLNHMDNGGQNE